MSILANTCFCLYLIHMVGGSTLTAPPLSALLVAFESTYDLSLLANTLSDQGIDAVLLVTAAGSNDIYNNLIDVEVLKLEIAVDKTVNPEVQGLQTCEALLQNEEILKKIGEIQPTFTIFPALRHDGCLIPWTISIDSIPIIWTRNAYEDVYAFERIGMALPIVSGGFWSKISTYLAWRSISSNIESAYVLPALKLAEKYLPNVYISRDHLYSRVRLVLWGADSVLRSDFASLSQLLVEVGCHHCRGSHPLPSELQKFLVEHRLGTIVVLLDKSYEKWIREIASKLPLGRQGQAVVWKSMQQSKVDESWPENFIVYGNTDRQDLIGYSRTRVVLMHCADTELLESAFHGTPVICFPRNVHETKNAARAVELGFAHSIEEVVREISTDEVVNIVNNIHEKLDYRENARRVSVGIRDRLNPASDRLVYWLGYIARTKNDNTKFFLTANNVSTIYEDYQFFVGLYVGGVIGLLLAGACMVLRYYVVYNRNQRSKGRYAR